jgi:hypothetical protein
VTSKHPKKAAREAQIIARDRTVRVIPCAVKSVDYPRVARIRDRRPFGRYQPRFDPRGAAAARIEAVNIVDMSVSNSWAEFAALFRTKSGAIHQLARRGVVRSASDGNGPPELRRRRRRRHAGTPDHGGKKQSGSSRCATRRGRVFGKNGNLRKQQRRCDRSAEPNQPPLPQNPRATKQRKGPVSNRVDKSLLALTGKCCRFATPRPCSDEVAPSLMARRQRPQGSKKDLAPAAAAARAGAQPPRKHLAVHACELAVEPHLQILRRHRRLPLLRLEHAHRSAMENRVHRPLRLGSRR